MDDRMKDPISETLERALQADPSPEFLARVRQRVATVPADRSWGGWKAGFASAGIAVVLVTVTWIAASRIEPPDRAAVMPVLASSEVATSVIENLVAARGTSLTRQRPLDPTERTAPAVLIPRGELAAFRQWIGRVQSGSFGFANVPEAVPVNQEVSVPEITLMPIGPSDSLE